MLRRIQKPSLIEAAKLFASTYHEGQKYGDKSYFDGHLIPVYKATVVSPQPHQSSYLGCVALLHDILEDTKCTQKILRTFFPKEVVDAVVLLTKEKGYNEKNYFDRIRTNELARAVKLADMSCNLRCSMQEGNRWRMNLYGRQLTMLYNED